jgi:hypothetical protein
VATVPAAAPAPAAPAPPPPVDPKTPVWQRAIQTELSALRGLPFKRPVAYGVQTRTAFRGYVRAELAREMPEAKGAALSRTYAQMGLVDAGFDLRRTLEEALTTQVAAYYDPREQVFRVLEHKRPERAASASGDEVIAHELQHALQDQHFDLMTFDGGEGNQQGLDDDERTARRFVSEGEATFVMMAWQIGSGSGTGKRLGPLAVAGLRMGVQMLAAADLVDVLSSMRQGGDAGGLDAESRAEIEALVKLPPVIVLPMVDPYLKGAQLVSEVWAKGGWPAVDDLFRHPPASTEQALHPEKFLARQDPPIRIEAPAKLPPVLDGGKLLTTDVLGELGWRIYFRTSRRPEADAAAAGWGGDRFWTWQIGGQPVVLTATRWDSDAEARQFFEVYAASLGQRFPRARPARTGTSVKLTRPGGGIVAVELRGQDVDIVDGARTSDLSALQAHLRAAIRKPR